MSEKPSAVLRAFVRTAALQQSGKRSSIMRPLIQMTGALGAVVPFMLWAGAPGWAVAIFAGAVALLALVFGVAFLVLMVRNPDALRSESYVLAREAMQRGYAGDNVLGLAQSESTAPALPGPAKLVSHDKGEA